MIYVIGVVSGFITVGLSYLNGGKYPVIHILLGVIGVLAGLDIGKILLAS